MNLWTAIVVIVAIVCLTELLKARHRARHGITRDSGGTEIAPHRPDPELEREVEQLRERVNVLERIATEERETQRLSAEIESLRRK